MNMTITNHKDTPVEIELNIGNYYGDNMKLTWNTQGALL